MLESKEILSLAKFNLRGWVHTGVSEAEKGTLLEEEKKVPVLGLIWKPDKDTLSVNWEENSKINEIPVTKRKNTLSCAPLINTTKIDLGLENVPIYCWSDSVNALYWIKRKENWGTFVNNRVQEIRRLTNPEDWKHIPGILNPADLPSRGCGVVELIASLWWEGPSWLNKPHEEWPLSEACPDRATIDSERKRTVASTINHEPKEMDYLSEISSFKKIIRVTAWIYRFYHNLRKQRNDRDFGELITQETDAAERKFFAQYIWNSLPLCLPRASYSLRRFISRRGRPFTIYSDNGKNLVGTSNELKNIDWKKVKDYGSLKKINWKLNPLSSPWWGGFWERLIGMLKIILRRVLGKACLTYEELYTVVCDSESVINSRPLTYLSEDQGGPCCSHTSNVLTRNKREWSPDLDLIDSQRMNRRFLYRERIRQELRKRFRLEYLGQLKSFSKSRKEDVIKEGDIVLIGDTNSKRIYWPLAKVIKLIPGRDGRVRVVEVSTSSGSFLRPIQRLYPLEVSGTDISDLPEQIKETLKDRV
ncbi:integrase catalytic domain-containing protein [Trichonephila clavipes]|nr:integrase catalytic domain-containing protein [Trichonephila clavipes]